MSDHSKLANRRACLGYRFSLLPHSDGAHDMVCSVGCSDAAAVGATGPVRSWNLPHDSGLLVSCSHHDGDGNDTNPTRPRGSAANVVTHSRQPLLALLVVRVFDLAPKGPRKSAQGIALVVTHKFLSAGAI